MALMTPAGIAIASPETSGDSNTAVQAISGPPVTSVGKTTGLNVDGETITVSGSGFSGSDPGIYVGLAQDNRFSTTNAEAWISTVFIRPSQITGGTWSTSVQVMAVKGASDCTENSCSIYTVAAHGSADR
ncbi:hypothetical protein ACFWPB_22540, partial [Rhodococcus sp. NPDC058514]